MTNPDPKAWSQANVLNIPAAAEYCGVERSYVRRACIQGKIANAWKPFGSGAWLMFKDDLIAWRKNTRKYTPKTIKR
jgi:hypothetical protein